MCDRHLLIFEICRRMLQLRKFHSVILTYISEVQILNLHISERVRASAKRV